MNWFDEDPEVLRAALEIIESWDGESFVNGVAVAYSSSATEETDSNNDDAGSEGGSELTSPAAATTTGGTASQAKRSPKTQTIAATPINTSAAPRELKPSTLSSTRHKRREEILYLRDKIADMETQLATLQKQNVDGGSSMTSEANGLNAALEVTWQDIASRQQRLREKAELEQAKLRGLLETQMKVASGLIKLMQKARRVEGDESFLAAKRAKLSIIVSDGVSEDDQSAHVDELHRRMDEAFSFAKFHDGTLKFIDVEVDDEGDNDVVIEFRDAWSLPFEIDEVVDAIWTFMGKRVEPRRCQEDYRKVCATDHPSVMDWIVRVGCCQQVVAVGSDTFKYYFSGSAKIGEFKGTFDGRGVSKRFPAIGEREAAIISAMCSLPHHEKGGELEGIRADEDNFLRVVSAQSLTGQSDGRVLSVVQSSHCFRLTFDVDKAPACRRNAGVLTDFVLGHITQERQLKHETVETLLLKLRSQ
jgi:hypothetical protein